MSGQTKTTSKTKQKIRKKIIEDTEEIYSCLIISSLYKGLISFRKNDKYIPLVMAKIREVSFSGRHFNILQGGDNFKVDVQETVHLAVAKYGNTNSVIQFSCQCMETLASGTASCKLRFPKLIEITYEREHYRVTPPLDKPLLAQCYTEETGILPLVPVLDIGLGGFAMDLSKSKIPLKVGTLIEAIDINFPDEVHTFCGQVRYKKGKRAGIQFVKNDYNDYTVIARYQHQRESEIITKVKFDGMSTFTPKEPSVAVKTARQPEKQETIDKKLAKDSPFTLLAMVELKLTNLFKSLVNEKQFQFMCDDGSFKPKVQELCDIIRLVCMEDEDLALGLMLLDHDTKYSVRHPLHTAVVCNSVANYFGWPSDKKTSLLSAAITMNFSINDLQDQLYVQKEPLDDDQAALVNGHPLASVNLLMKLAVNDNLWLSTVEQHHERLDGSGYPHGIKGAKMIDASRILAMADVYSARLSNRNYRPALPSNIVLKKMFLEKEEAFDANLNIAFAKIFGMFVPGTLVKLKNSEIGVVVMRGSKIYKPIVRTVVDQDGYPVSSPSTRDTNQEEFSIVEALSANSVNVSVNMHKLWNYGKFSPAKSTMRKHSRIDTDIPAKLLDPEKVLTADATIVNLSEGGCLIKITQDAKREFDIFRKYNITFKLLDKAVGFVEIHIKSINRKLDHILYGAEFVDLKPEVRKTLLKFMEKYG